jgi:hypothetical protein
MAIDMHILSSSINLMAATRQSSLSFSQSNMLRIARFESRLRMAHLSPGLVTVTTVTVFLSSDLLFLSSFPFFSSFPFLSSLRFFSSTCTGSGSGAGGGNILARSLQMKFAKMYDWRVKVDLKMGHALPLELRGGHKIEK